MRQLRLPEQADRRLQAAVISPDIRAERRTQIGRQLIQRAAICLEGHRIVARFFRERRDVLTCTGRTFPISQALALVCRSREALGCLARVPREELHEAAQNLEARELSRPEARTAREPFCCSKQLEYTRATLLHRGPMGFQERVGLQVEQRATQS